MKEIFAQVISRLRSEMRKNCPKRIKQNKLLANNKNEHKLKQSCTGTSTPAPKATTSLPLERHH